MLNLIERHMWALKITQVEPLTDNLWLKCQNDKKIILRDLLL